MAIVSNLAFVGNSDFPVDKALMTQNRTVAVSPVAVTTPQFIGEIVLDTASNKLWKAMDLTNIGWVEHQEVVNHPT